MYALLHKQIRSMKIIIRYDSIVFNKIYFAGFPLLIFAFFSFSCSKKIEPHIQLELERRFIFDESFYRYIERGDTYYKEKDYLGALQCYASAFQNSKSREIRLYDSLQNEFLINYIGISKERANLLNKRALTAATQVNINDAFELLYCFQFRNEELLADSVIKRRLKIDSRFEELLRKADAYENGLANESKPKEKVVTPQKIPSLNTFLNDFHYNFFILFSFIPISCIILLFKPVKSKRGRLLNVLLIANSVAYLLPLIIQIIRGYTIGMEYILLVLFVCTLVQIILFILKLVDNSIKPN